MGGRGTASGLTPAAEQPAQAPQTERPPRRLTRADVDDLQRAMGQTGLEAGDPNVSPDNKVYVNTSKAFNINAYLRSDGTSVHDASNNSDWENLGYTRADAARAVAQIDAGMAPLPEALELTRFVGAGALGSMLGNPKITTTNAARIIRSIATPQGAQKFAQALRNASYTEKAYTSTTYWDTHPAFNNRQIRLNIIARPGTPAIVTSNHREAEVLLGRNLHYRFTGGFRVETTSAGVQQLVIDVEV